MNTLAGGIPVLKIDKSTVLFANKNLEFGFPDDQLQEIKRLWNNGKGINYISKWTKRTHHEVFLALYEFWMDGKIDGIERAFKPKYEKGLILVPGKEILKRELEK